MRNLSRQPEIDPCRCQYGFAVTIYQWLHETNPKTMTPKTFRQASSLVLVEPHQESEDADHAEVIKMLTVDYVWGMWILCHVGMLLLLPRYLFNSLPVSSLYLTQLGFFSLESVDKSSLSPHPFRHKFPVDRWRLLQNGRELGRLLCQEYYGKASYGMTHISYGRVAGTQRLSRL